MTIGAALVLYAVIWFMVLFIVLPLRLQTQDESGQIVPGTPASAPTNPNLKRKALIVTIAASIIWCVAAGLIVYDVIPLDMFNVYDRVRASEN